MYLCSESESGGSQMLIGEVARSTGLKASAIRFYEAHGVVPRPVRTPGGYRDYNSDDVDLLRFVHRLRALKLPLDDIREVVSLRTDGAAPCDAMRESIARELSAIDREIEDLRRIRGDLARLRIEADRIEDDWPVHCVCDLVNSGGPNQPGDSPVEITLRYFVDCPNWQVVESHLNQIGVTVRHQRIESFEVASEYGFRGSPTVLVNGVDPFYDPDAQVGLVCRVYVTPQGLAGSPSIDQIEEVIASARSPNR